MNRCGWVCLFLLIVLAALAGASLPAAAQVGYDSPAACEMLAALNQWRLDQNVWPLHPNRTLELMARDQAEYLLSLPEIPDGPQIHVGRTGEGPRERARWPRYNWPVYDYPDRISLTEISAAQPDVAAAIMYWRGSDVHRRSALNPNYREVGIAALPWAYGTLFVVVMAGQPDVLPVMIHPDSTVPTLYLSNETFEGAQWAGCIHEATDVRLLDGNQTPLTDWQPWQPTLPLPAVRGSTLFVQFSNNINRSDLWVTTEVNLRDDVFPLPGFRCCAPTERGTASPTPPEATSPPPTETPRRPPTAVETHSPTPTPETGIRLIYDSSSLTLLNASGCPRVLSGLEMTNGQTTFAVERWDNGYLTAPLDSFPPGDCLQVWLYDDPEQPKPSCCQTRHAWITVHQPGIFWAEGEFQVLYNGAVLATCQAAAGECLFELP